MKKSTFDSLCKPRFNYSVKFFREHLQILRHTGPILFVLTLFYNFIDQIITLKIEASMSSPNGPTSQVWFFAGFSLLVSILLPVLIQFFGLYALLKTQLTQIHFSQFYSQNLSQLYIETLRSWGKSMLWGFLFIIPGLILYFEYFYVPFVVTALPAYQNGKLDALATSRTLVKRHWFKLSLVLACFQIIVPIMNKSIFDDYSLFLQTPVTAILLSALDTFIFIFSIQIFYRMFIKTIAEESHESLLSMARH